MIEEEAEAEWVHDRLRVGWAGDRVRTLRTAGRGGEVADEIVEFLGAAQRTLDLAHYDFHLADETAAIIGGAIRRRTSAA